MVVNKPTIIIYTNDPDQEFFMKSAPGSKKKDFCMRFMKEPESWMIWHMKQRRFHAGSGIGMSGQRIAMQMRRLPKGHNVFELNAPRFWQCRNLGANSARAVKKMPFKAIYREE